MTDHPIEGAERLSAEELAEIAKRSDWYFSREKEDDERTADSFFNPDGYRAHLDRAALLSHIASLSAPQSQISEERLRGIFLEWMRDSIFIPGDASDEYHNGFAFSRALMITHMAQLFAAIQSSVSEASGWAEALSQPNEPGAFVGDIWFGHPIKRNLGTHRWNGDVWEALPDEIESLMTLLANARVERNAVIEECAKAIEPKPTDRFDYGLNTLLRNHAAKIRALKTAQPTGTGEKT